MSIGFCQSDAIAVFLFLCGILALSGASRQLPQRGSLWRVGQAHAGRAKFLYIENSSALLQRAAASEQYPCQAAANLCSRALFFTLYQASGVQ